MTDFYINLYFNLQSEVGGPSTIIEVDILSLRKSYE